MWFSTKFALLWYLVMSGDIFNRHNWWDRGAHYLLSGSKPGILLHTLQDTRQADTVNNYGSKMLIVWSWKALS